MSERYRGPSTPASRRRERAVAGAFLDWSGKADHGERPVEEIPLPPPVDGECGMDPRVFFFGAEQICHLPKDHPLPHRYQTRSPSW